MAALMDQIARDPAAFSKEYQLEAMAQTAVDLQQRVEDMLNSANISRDEAQRAYYFLGAYRGLLAIDPAGKVIGYASGEGVYATFDPLIGPSRLIFAFEAVIIGGLGSLWGTLAGGIIIGVAQTVGAAINPEWQILAGHVAFLLVLLVRPRGLFPRGN